MFVLITIAMILFLLEIEFLFRASLPFVYFDLSDRLIFLSPFPVLDFCLFSLYISAKEMKTLGRSERFDRRSVSKNRHKLIDTLSGLM
ncbi:MAG: hypothetical protein C4B57_07805 [Deltaproteobacteria bacterium]|nr:MAG: hypothetical protein C4B57_07805 [Deltaproteobacteria bacterium]